LGGQNSTIACRFESFFVMVGGPGKNTALDTWCFEWCSSHTRGKQRRHLAPTVCLVNMAGWNLLNRRGVDAAAHHCSRELCFGSIENTALNIWCFEWCSSDAHGKHCCCLVPVACLVSMASWNLLNRRDVDATVHWCSRELFVDRSKTQR
jgi:hypothetical protein